MENRSLYLTVFSLREFLCLIVLNRSVVLAILIAFSLGGNLTAIELQGSSAGKQSQQDDVTITGRVLDQDGEPIPGVTITVSGTTTGSVSDQNGSYTISVPANATQLEFSFVGMRKELVDIKGRTIINVTMQPDALDIDEVVIVGYGTQKKVNLTGGVDVVNADVIENRPIANVSQALQGTAPGLTISANRFAGGEPGAKMDWSIRGLGSPYVLVDGVPTEAHLINPEDIETVSVLKDAAASAIYGSRAPYGVVLITTKRGKAGEKVTVNYGSNLVWSSPIRLPVWMSSVDFAKKYNYALANSGQPAYYSPEDIQELQAYIDGDIDYETKANGNVWDIDDAGLDGNANNDWGDIYFKDNTLRQKHDLSLRGGGENLTYYISAGIFDQEGELNFGDISYDRYNFNSSLDARVTDWLKLSFNTKYARDYTITPFGEEGFDYRVHWHNMLRLAPTSPLYLPNGELNYFSRVLVLEEGGSRHSIQDDLWLTGGAEFEPIKGWKTNIRYSRNQNTINYRDLQKVYFSHYPDGTEYISSYNKSSNFRRRFNVNDYNMLNVTTSYDRSFEDHYMYLLLGYEQEDKELSGLWGLGRGQLSQKTPNIDSSLGDPTFPDFQSRDAGDLWSHWATRGFFGRFNYNYMEKYLLELNARYNGSSNFMNAETQWGFFPSVSVGYNISKEEFWSPISAVVNNLKIRASYGSVGNDYTDYSYIAIMPSITPVDPNASWPPDFYIMNNEPLRYVGTPDIPSPTITWETVTTINVGLDAGVLNNRLQTSLDYFITERSDIIIPAQTQIPSVLGTETEVVNAGKQENRGFELTLSWKDTKGELHYGFTALLGDSRRKWTYYPTEVNTIYTFGEHLDPRFTGTYEGEIWGFETAGFFSDDADVESHADQTTYIYNGDWSAGDIKYKDLDGNDTISIGSGTLEDHGDLKLLGNTTPRFNFGISITADYKGFDFFMFLQGVGKRDWIYLNRAHAKTKFFGYARGMGQDSHFVEHTDYWTSDNPDAYLPKPYANPASNMKNYEIQSKYIQNAAYLRLKSIQIGYSLPLSVISKMKIEKLRIYISAENLLTFTGVPSQYDPELLGRAYLGTGKIYPLRRNISLGLNVTL